MTAAEPRGQRVRCCGQHRPVAVQVNKRVADEEFKDHSGDPFFPKAQWPTPELCPLCRAPSVTAGAGKGGSEAEPEWNEDEVWDSTPASMCLQL